MPNCGQQRATMISVPHLSFCNQHICMRMILMFMFFSFFFDSVLDSFVDAELGASPSYVIAEEVQSFRLPTKAMSNIISTTCKTNVI